MITITPTDLDEKTESKFSEFMFLSGKFTLFKMR